MLRNGLQPSHLIILLVVVLLVFGAAKLPDIAASVGKSLKVFKKEIKELREDDDAPPPSGPAEGQQHGRSDDQPGPPSGGAQPPPGDPGGPVSDRGPARSQRPPQQN